MEQKEGPDFYDGYPGDQKQEVIEILSSSDDSENDVVSNVLQQRDVVADTVRQREEEIRQERKNKHKLEHYEGKYASYFPDDPDVKEYDENGMEMPFYRQISLEDVKKGYVHVKDICIHKLSDSKLISSRYKKHKSKLKRLRLQTKDNIRRIAQYAYPNLFNTLKDARIPDDATSPCGHVTAAGIANPDFPEESMNILKNLLRERDTSTGPFDKGQFSENIISSLRKSMTHGLLNTAFSSIYKNKCNTVTVHRNDQFYKVANRLKKNECTIIEQGIMDNNKYERHMFQMCRNPKGKLVQLAYGEDEDKNGVARPKWLPMYGKGKNKCFEKNHKCIDISVTSASRKNANIFRTMDSESWPDHLNTSTGEILKNEDRNNYPAE